MNLNKCIFTKNDCYKKNVKLTPKGIVVHSTACNNPYLKRYVQPDDGKLGKNKYGNDWNQPNLSVSVHAFIGKLDNGKIATYQTLPWDIKCWGCGSGKKGSYNNNYIQFEICEDDLKSKSYFDKVYQEAVELCVELIELYPTIKVDNIVCHKEAYTLGYASNHADVTHWFPRHGKSMASFRRDVQTLLDKHKINGFVKADNGKMGYYIRGILQKDTTNLVKDTSDGSWYYVKKGYVADETTLVQYCGKWYYINKGKVDFTATTLCKYGKTWYYVNKGAVDFKANTIIQYYGVWYYVKDGKVDFTFNGIYVNTQGTWKVDNGKITFGTTGLINITDGAITGWHYFTKSRLDTSPRVVKNYSGTWYVKDGKVDFTFTGEVTIDGRLYTVNKNKCL